MNNLPSNPTRFDKFRNTAFKVALSTGFTRKILANLAPQSALDYASTLEDNQEFVDVVLSMNDRTLEKNIRRISEPIKKLVYDTEIDNKNSDIIKSILGRMPENRKEYFSKLYIQSNSIISYEKMDSIFEASKNINYSNLSDEELNNYIIHYANLLPNRSNQVYYNILEQLPYERRINFFDEIIYNSHFNSYYQNDKRINDYLALIKPEDRLEKFKTILAEVNKKQQLGDFTDITSCFQMLGENERKEIFGALIEYVSKAEQSYQKENCAFNIISSATNIEEQKKYIDVCLDLYKNGKESKAIIAFTNKIEPELRKEKASELIKLYTTTLNLEMQQTYVSSVSDNIIPFLTLFDNTEQNEIIESLLAHTSLSNLDYKNLFSKLPSEQQFKHFYGFQEKMEQNRKDYDYSNIFLDLYSALKKETKQSLLKELCETSDNKSLENLQKIFNAHYYSPIAIAEVSQGQCILDDKTIIELMKRDSTIVEKVLLFDKDISEYIKNIDFESYTEDPYTANSKFLEGLPKNVVKKYFNIFYEIQKDKNYMRNHENFSTLYKLVDNETKKDVLAKHIINGEEKDLQLVNNILNEHNAKELVHISDGEITIDEKTIMELIQINPNNVNKVLLFHKEACEHLKNIDIANMNSNEIVSSLPKEFIGKYLNEFAKSHKNEPLKFFDKAFSNLYTSLDDNIKVDLFKYFASNSEKRNLASLTMILNNYDIKDLVRLFGNQVTLDEETIKALIQQDSNIAMKTMLFDKDIDREKIIDLTSYSQLNNSGHGIDINSIISNIYSNQDFNKYEINDKIDGIYNLFTYNNIPEFLKTFRIFQLSSYHEVNNNNLKTLEGKSLQERDSIFLEDLFKISLDSNSESLRNFAKVLGEGKRITTTLQRNPYDKIKKLSEEELAILHQYRDTLFDLHNLTRDIRNTNRPKLNKTDDIIADMKKLVTTYTQKENTSNLVFNPHIIMDELMGEFISTQIRPKAILSYMDKKAQKSDNRHKFISEQIKTNSIHLKDGDYIKGVSNFESYLPSLLKNGLKGGEFNQEFSHSDLTPLDADFGFVEPHHLGDGKLTDGQIIRNTTSIGYGKTYIVMKNYQERLDARADTKFDDGKFSGQVDYYHQNEGDRSSSSYIRTGIPSTDIDYIVSNEWQPRFGYEMAMAGMFIPVKDMEDTPLFTYENYENIRNQMKGLSYYGAEPIEVNPKATQVDPLFELYKKVSPKPEEEIDAELQQIRDLISGKEDTITMQKKSATLAFIQDYFSEQGIAVTDNLSQNLVRNSVELIDTGSTGRGTNIPGDGDFDFMLRHNMSSETLTGLGKFVGKRVPENGEFIEVGDGFRTKGVILPSGEKVDIDVTSAPKSLNLEYSSDMCVKDRLHSIKENNPEKYNYVLANIIMAKKILKATGIYKKFGSDGSTQYGGFGGIGVENWVLQNGGSFTEAMNTYLETANKTPEYEDFIQAYPIFDFGNNHREGSNKHDRFSAFLGKSTDAGSKSGFDFVKEKLTEYTEIVRSVKEPIKTTPLEESISVGGLADAIKHKEDLRNPFSYATVTTMIAKMKAQHKVQHRAQQEHDNQTIKGKESEGDSRD